MISARPRILIKVAFLKQFALEVWVSIVKKNRVFDSICRPTGDKWQSKTLFLTIFDPRSSVVKSIFDCHLFSAILVINDFETLITGYAIIPGVR